MAGIERRLTKREENFCWLVARGMPASRARLEAGYQDLGGAKRNADAACILSRKQSIRDYIARARREYVAELGIDFERLLIEALHIGLADMGEAVDSEGLLLPLASMPEGVRRAIKSYTQDVLWVGKPNSEGAQKHMVRTKITLHPKFPALERLIEAAGAARAKANGKPAAEAEDLSEDELMEIESGAEA